MAHDPTVILRVVYSTIAGSEIARVVEAAYDLGPVAQCHLIRRGFNDMYELRMADGGRYAARLGDRRERGEPNIVYEVAFLTHLKACGVTAAGPVPARDGRLWRELQAPEGLRTFVVFEHLAGQGPRNVLADVAVMGATLAAIHAAGETYAGPPGRYRFDADHLLTRPLARILGAPTIDAELAAVFSGRARDLEARLVAVAPDLVQVACHGDCHGGNTFMSDAPDGTRIAGFFDFDDSGRGFLAYDLAVYLWSMLLQMPESGRLNDAAQGMWTHFIGGYRGVRPIPDADVAAIALFVPLRHMLFMGEYCGRVPEWGMESVSHRWLGRQAVLMGDWDGLVTPPASPVPG